MAVLTIREGLLERARLARSREERDAAWVDVVIDFFNLTPYLVRIPGET